jgi:hypothetical protein
VLAGEIAAKLQGSQVPELDAAIIRAIALHDAGWGIPDAQAINRSRTGNVPSQSFLDVGITAFLDAWTGSIEVSQTVSPAGGYIVSRHFWRLAEHALAHGAVGEKDRESIEMFLGQEARRQKRLSANQNRIADELELLTDVLQFCDLLSLYICCGARDNVEFPKYFGVTARLQVEGESYRLVPALVAPSQFRVAALRYPATKEESSRAILVSIT